MHSLVPIAFFAMIVLIVKFISDNKIRKKIIEAGNLNQSLKYLWEKSYARKPLQSLKVGAIAVAIGLIFLVGSISKFEELVIAGASLVSVGIIYIIYYFIEHKKEN